MSLLTVDGTEAYVQKLSIYKIEFLKMLALLIGIGRRLRLSSKVFLFRKQV